MKSRREAVAGTFFTGLLDGEARVALDDLLAQLGALAVMPSSRTMRMIS